MHWHNHHDHDHDQLPTHMWRQQASTNCICFNLESLPSWAKPNVCLAQMPLLTLISGDLSSLVYSKFWWHHYLQFCLSGLSCCVSGIISWMPNALINLLTFFSIHLCVGVISVVCLPQIMLVMLKYIFSWAHGIISFRQNGLWSLLWFPWGFFKSDAR